MEQISDTKSPKVVQQESLQELLAKLERIDSRTRSDEKLSVDDGKIISNLGWISILSVTIAGLTMGSLGVGL
jgi:hypothetical protein